MGASRAVPAAPSVPPRPPPTGLVHVSLGAQLEQAALPSCQNCLPTARCSHGERRRLPGMVQAQLMEPLPCPRGRGGFQLPAAPR